LTDPLLLAFDLSMDGTNGLLTLYFSEVVNAGSIDISSFTLQSTGTSQASSHTLEDATATLDNATIVELSLGDHDMNAIKAIRDLAIDSDSTFLAVKSDAVRDMNLRKIVAIPFGSAKAVQNYNADITAPVVTAFDFDLNSDLMSLTFSETVNAATFDPSAMTIQGLEDTSLSSLSYDLTGGEASQIDSTIVSLNLTHGDSNAIKRLIKVASSSENTFLSFSEQLVNDTAGNQVTPRAVDSAITVSNYTADGVRPTIENFDFDLASGTLVLSFSETMNASSIDVTLLTLFSEGSGESYNFTLEAAAVSSTNTENITVTLNVSDLNRVKAIPSLCTTSTNCHLAAAELSARDMNENRLLNTGRISATAVEQDSQGSRLLGFILNLEAGTITVVFDETVIADTMNATKIILSPPVSGKRRARAISGASFRVSSSSTVVPGRNTHVVVKLSDADLDRLKLIPSIWSAGAATMNLESAAVLDTAGIPSLDARDVASLSIEADNKKPTLECFELDMNTGTLKLSFSEVMNITSLKRELFQMLGANVTDGVNELQLSSAEEAASDEAN